MKHLFLLLILVLFSCSNKDQEKYLLQSNIVLENEISNLNWENNNLYGSIVSDWEKQGRPEKYQPLLDSAKTTLTEYKHFIDGLQDLKQKIEFDSVNESEYLTSLSAAGLDSCTKGLSNSLKVMEIYNVQLARSIDAYVKLKTWREEIESPDYNRTSPYLVISSKRNKILRGEKYEARIELAARPQFKDSDYSARVNGKELG